MGFIKVNNRKNFLVSKVPTLHPKSIAYLRYWKEQKKRNIEGFWSIDNADINIDVNESMPEELLTKKNDWRYMPGNLYFYVNFGTILHQDEDGPKAAPKKKIRPYLRDVEWEFFYNWLEARGFSGFHEDPNVTCLRDVSEYLSGKSLGRISDIHKSAFKKDVTKELKRHKELSKLLNKGGEKTKELNKEILELTDYLKEALKEYVPASIYLRQLHTTPLGRPLYENGALNLFMLGARGFGKSFMVGVGITLYELLFDGAKEYNEESIKNPYQVEVFVGAAIAAKSSDILKKTKDGMENLPGAWAQGTAEFAPSPLYKQMSGTLSPNNIKNPWRHEYDKKIGGSWSTCGTGSNIKHGIYTTENPEAAAGTRPGVMVVEEVGLMGNVLQVHGSNTACQMEGTTKFGSSVYLGTGGNVEKIQESEIIFRDPEGFDFLPFIDEWEQSGKIGWFVPAIYGLNQFKDENGNTDEEAALEYKKGVRELKRKSKDPSALSMEMMNYPLVPSEMFLNAKGSMFPQAELKAHLATVKTNPHRYANAHYFGELIWQTDGELIWENGNPNELVSEFPVKDNKNKPGIIEIFEMPKKDASGNVQPNRYIQGTDTYDDDESVTNSLGCTWVLDLYTDRIVAEYTGRRAAKEFYEITRKLNIYYRTTHNYEKNKKGLYTYYEQKRSTHLLCDTPESLKDVADITISRVGNQSKGTSASKQINAYGLRLILDWLISPAYGEDEHSEKLNLHTIRSIGLLEELIHFNPNGNFDRVSALIMTMIIKEELYRYTEKRQEAKIQSLAQDDFFTKRFRTNWIEENEQEEEQWQMDFESLAKRRN